MPAAPDDSLRISDYIAGLLGPDPYLRIRQASVQHREAHGEDCDVHPSNPLSMRLISVLVQACHAERVLEIGCGLGYSAAWLAEAVGSDGKVVTIERDPLHVDLARVNFREAGLEDRIHIHQGEADDILQTLNEEFDLVYDDAWFIGEPAYLERMVELMRPGGLLVMANWFPLEDAVAGEGEIDWADPYGENWAERIQDYAKKLASHPGLSMAFALDPWLALAAKAK